MNFRSLLIILMACLCFCPSLKAQFKKGQSFLYGGLSFNTQLREDSKEFPGALERWSNSFSIRTGAGYFIKKNTSVFLLGHIGRSNYNSIEYTYKYDTLSTGAVEQIINEEKYKSISTTYRFGIGVRQFFPIEKKVYAFLYNELNLTKSRSKSVSKGVERVTINQIEYALEIEPGLGYILNKRFAFEAQFNGLSLTYMPKQEKEGLGEISGSFGGFSGINLGFLYFLK